MIEKWYTNYFLQKSKNTLNIFLSISIFIFFISNCLFLFLANNVIFYTNKNHIEYTKEMKRIDFLLKNNINTLIENKTFATKDYIFTVKENSDSVIGDYYIKVTQASNDSLKQYNAGEFIYIGKTNTVKSTNDGGYIRESRYPNETFFSLFIDVFLMIFDLIILKFIVFINIKEFKLRKIKYLTYFANKKTFDYTSYIVLKFLFLLGACMTVVPTIIHIKMVSIMLCYTLFYIFMLLFYLSINFKFINDNEDK